jgi:hypothetical protein
MKGRCYRALALNFPIPYLAGALRKPLSDRRTKLCEPHVMYKDQRSGLCVDFLNNIYEANAGIATDEKDGPRGEVNLSNLRQSITK